MRDILISVCAICKDEAQNVKAFLNSWAAVADEIVVLDTGSTDGTQDILAESSARWHQASEKAFRFDDARNVTKKLARGKWILWADLDDRLDLASVEAIREIAEKSPPAAYAFQVASKMPTGTYHRFTQIRMFPNHPEIYWERPVHETLEKSIQKAGLPVGERPDIIIAHLGYETPELKERKAQRNLEMLYASGLVDAPACAQMGDSHYILGQWAKGLKAYYNAYAQAPEWKSRLAEKILVGHLYMGRIESAEEWLVDIPPGIARDFWAGEINVMRGRFGDALAFYKAALCASPTVNYAGSTSEALVQKAEKLVAAMEGRA